MTDASKPKKPQKGKSGNSKPAKDTIAKDAIPAMRNFLLGLAVCCITVVTAVLLVLNIDSIKQLFVSASQKVSRLVPESKNQPEQQIQQEAPPPPDENDNYSEDEKPEVVKPAPSKRHRTRIEY